MATFASVEVLSQPEIWEQVVDLHSSVAHQLPAKGERVAFVGCGTSWFVSMSAAVLRESKGLGESDAFTANEFPLNRKYDRIVAITRSGTTSEVIELLEKLAGQNTVVITAVADSPCAELAKEAIVLDFADEQSVLQTRYATSVLALLRTHFGEDLTGAIADCRQVLAQELDAELVASTQITFLGTGWTVGLAHEAALKTRESSQYWAEAYPAMDYRHGPISIAEPGRSVWVFGDVPAGLEKDVAKTGAKFVHLELDPMASLVMAQRIALAITESKGLNADTPRHLSRSIVLS
ncbi:SIS domain-containing protein [Candidatus Aquiluna sp. UB-MaderosW2red]|uniref:SIS domain-containing protein n=1 Tax=Candidatus Aquiluna sp. UB-MaderosW2red TaxID=1855377 RepID=UPI000875BDC3|nr:SIS domain-containing protein [Candidatus Aquiluna sp. UB-MaderosW2red]SCX03831.1 Fructoselysine-6-P-deglycase FrlB with duplicated sugar isomerase (SIS) domain [Candidatus Aquiluna sp. UB-MaderosW2red]